jgi:SAM-dependent methyltransferase
VLIEGIRCYDPDQAHGCPDYPEEGLTDLLAVEDGHFWFESRNRMLRELLRLYLPRSGGRTRFLEIGCGTGFVLRMLAEIPGLEVSGSEIHLSGVKMAARRVPGVEVFQMDALRMEFAQSYEAIGLFDVLEHLDADV